ncbi:hypothetical protein [Bartonella rattaustraliani]|uniref:hypothetical protein n=1 Tax=Bartonella rattaustraliani TaxID=481139 RepID=UPI0003645B95|nr:hypothetical protein [Bartonella rattaustraliani]
MALSYFKNITSLGIVIIGMLLSGCAYNYTQADLEKYQQSNTHKFFQSDAYKKLGALLYGMSQTPSGGSGWDALAHGTKYLHHYPYAPPGCD